MTTNYCFCMKNFSKYVNYMNKFSKYVKPITMKLLKIIKEPMGKIGNHDVSLEKYVIFKYIKPTLMKLYQKPESRK